MKKIGSMFATVMAFLVVTALPAVAAGYAPPPPVAGTHGAQGQGNGGGTAFTGTDLSVGVLLLVALVLAGGAALLIARRAAARRQTVQ